MKVERQLSNSSGDGRFPSDMDFGQEPVSVPIADVFDLHPFAPRDVQSAVEAYLEEAHSLGLTELRIIHGRGIGVQRETVRKVLARTPFVLTYSDAPAEAGGWGATIVTLAPAQVRE
jgi:DNA-nicking Smr family endonuclease